MMRGEIERFPRNPCESTVLEREVDTVVQGAADQGLEAFLDLLLKEPAVELLTDFPELFETRRKLFALGDSGKQSGAAEPNRRKLELDEHWFHKGMVVLKFAGVDSISDAETLVGSEIQLYLRPPKAGGHGIV